MRRVIYADTLVVMNVAVTYILLLSVRSFSRVKTSPVRLISASFAGGGTSLLIFLPPLPPVFSILLRMAACLLITFIAFFVGDGKKYLKSLLLFLAMTFLYGGVMFFLSQTVSEFVVYRNGYGYVGIGFPGVVLAVSAVYVVLRWMKRKLGKGSEQFRYEIELKHADRTAKGSALFDSGHFVTDCYNGQPVILVRERLLRQLLPEGELEELKNMSRFSATIPAVSPKCRYIPVQTVSGDRLLPAFTCEKVIVTGEDTYIDVDNVSLAFAGLLDGVEHVDALINARLFERR